MKLLRVGILLIAIAALWIGTQQFLTQRRVHRDEDAQVKYSDCLQKRAAFWRAGEDAWFYGLYHAEWKQPAERSRIRRKAFADRLVSLTTFENMVCVRE